jgi:hypothetical protein
MAITISGDSPNLTSASLTTPTLTSATLTSPTISGTPTGVGVLTSMTAQASTSGTSIDFTSIPSWVKRITVMFDSVSTSGANNLLIQIGAGSVETTGYVSTGAYAGPTNSAGGTTSTAGYLIFATGAANTFSGHLVLTAVGSNVWVSSHTIGVSTFVYSGGGTKTASGTLDRVRITTAGGTDTFDAGTINILYE